MRATAYGRFQADRAECCACSLPATAPRESRPHEPREFAVGEEHVGRHAVGLGAFAPPGARRVEERAVGGLERVAAARRLAALRLCRARGAAEGDETGEIREIPHDEEVLAHVEQLLVRDEGVEGPRVEAAERGLELQGQQAQLRAARVGLHAATHRPMTHLHAYRQGLSRGLAGWSSANSDCADGERGEGVNSVQ